MIYGTPVFESPNTVYTIVAQNERGRTSTTVELYVRSGCADITDFAATPVGQTETYYCSRVNGMYGKVKRTCTEVACLGSSCWLLQECSKCPDIGSIAVDYRLNCPSCMVYQRDSESKNECVPIA